MFGKKARINRVIDFPQVQTGYSLFVPPKTRPSILFDRLEGVVRLAKGVVIVRSVAAVEELESGLFTEEELEEVGRVVRQDRVGRGGRVVFEVGLGFGFPSGELEFELVVGIDLVIDLVGRKLLESGLCVESARGRAPDEAHEPAPFSGARAECARSCLEPRGAVKVRQRSRV